MMWLLFLPRKAVTTILGEELNMKELKKVRERAYNMITDVRAWMHALMVPG